MPDIFEYLRYTANLIAGSRFGNQIILKVGSVLLSKLIECGREDLFRFTRDLDIHCDKKEVWMDFYTNIESVLNINDRGYIYKITKRRSQVVWTARLLFVQRLPRLRLCFLKPPGTFRRKAAM